MKFDRRLKASYLRQFASSPGLRKIVEVVKAKELDLQLRGTYVDVYAEGFIIFEIDFPKRSVRVGSIHDKGSSWITPAGHPIPISKLDPNEVESLVDQVMKRRGERMGKGSEGAFEARVILNNSRPSSRMIPLDRQIVNPGQGDRLDLLLYDRDAERLVIAELKVSPNSEVQGKVFQQLRRYQNLLTLNPNMAATYPHVFEQKVALGTLDHDLRGMRVDQPPMLLLLLSRYQLKKDGARRDTDYLHRARRLKAKDFAYMDVRVHQFDDFGPTSDCKLPTIFDLPVFETWCAENLTEISGPRK